MRFLKIRTDFVCLLLIALVIGLFFLPLFYPQAKLIVTPDFGRSDSWHFSFATKYALWESLHQGKLPLWTDKIGDGFPLFADGQIGTFFLPNLILFNRIDSPVVAYNVSLVVTVIILALGVYVWLRTLGVSPFPSLFGGLTFILSGVVILQIPHFTPLQGLSLMPWIMILTHLLVRNPNRLKVGGLAFIVSQQVFAGFPQATFITLLLSGSYLLWRFWSEKFSWPSILAYLVAYLGGFALSAVQIFPSWELLSEAGLKAGLAPDIASYFSFPLVHLKSFFTPFALGDPKIGTYPSFTQFDGSIFWENTGYIGLFPLLLLPIAIRFRTRLISFFLVTLIVSFLLMWGSHSPLYIIYSIWPFNLFRVPSRFIWVFVLTLVSISSVGLEKALNVNRGKLVFMCAILLTVINTGNLFFLWNRYHLLVPAKSWQRAPELTRVIGKDARISTIGTEVTYNSIFLQSGWKNPAPYTFLKNDLSADSNLVWGVASHDIYVGRTLRRPSIFDSFLTSHIHMTSEVATISATGQKLLDLSGVTNLLTTVPIEIEGGTQKPVIYDETSPEDTLRINVYANTSYVPRAYLASHFIEVHSLEEAQHALTEDTFIPGKSVLIEKPLDLPTTKGNAVARIVSQTTDSVRIVTESASNALLVLSDTYYSGWVARLDSKKTSILPVNIRYRGVIVPSGVHTVEFRYEPKSFRFGSYVSGVSILLWIILVAFPGSSFASHRWPSAPPHVSHRPRTRGRSGLRRG